MRRLVIAIIVLIGATLSAPAARAAGTKQSATTGAIKASSQLKIPLSTTYPPAGFATAVNGQLAPADADTSTLQALFLHGEWNNNTGQSNNVSYHNIGAIGMWYQEFHQSLTDGYTAYLTYLGSYYASPDA